MALMSRINRKVKSVIFDMDGVITNTMPDHFLAWEKSFKEFGLNVTHMDIYKREGQPGLQSLKDIFIDHGYSFNLKIAHQILNRKEGLFKQISRVRFIKGARSFIKNLYRQGFQLGIVTGTARDEMKRILPMSILNCFEVVVTGSDVKHGKPHPEPYLKALFKMGIHANDGLVIENAPFGIRSAKQAGLLCVALMTSLPQKYLNEADFIFKSYQEMQNMLHFELKD